MTYKFFFKAFFKIVHLLKINFNSFIQSIKLRGMWHIDKGLVVEGAIYVHNYAGDVHIGKHVRLGDKVRIGACKNAKIYIGNNVSINQGTFVIARDEVFIGNDTRIGEYCSIRDNDHSWENPNVKIRKQGYTSKRTFIGNDVWIGRGCVISKGVEIGNGSVIGANSVVTKSVPEYSVAVGVPAKIIKKRGE